MKARAKRTRETPGDRAIRMVAAHDGGGVDRLFELIEHQPKDFAHLLRSIDPTHQATERRRYTTLQKALPRERQADLVAYADAMSADATVRLQAGFLLGMAMARRIFDRHFRLEDSRSR